ncbi:hypothetical protein [Duganella callida]|uniref:Uncharacterized protein n=1 Tax=Duganella callida TaxID=2561932 RepID=A0A4Y9SMN2_9BURK|nr:hypothetical protein [Duganella callida]TFW27915.1 hypothetical protein E4L98_06230 [Duganella callida]
MEYMTALELQQAYAIGDVLSVALVARHDVFGMRISTPGGLRILSADAIDQPLRFQSPAEASAFLHQIGLENVELDVDSWRADLRAQRYDAWLAAKVESSLAGLKDSSNRVFPPDEWAAIRAAKAAKRGAS